MKHIKTFESFLNEGNSFKQIVFGVVTKVLGKSFKAMVIADGGDEQPTTGFGIGPGGSELWKPGITAAELRKELKKAGLNGSSATVRFEDASPWNP